jgi:cysteinyl-tRNA synthetase
MSKSLGNFYTVDDIEKEGIDPVSLRLLFLQTHYRQPMNFTWEAARGTHEAYKRLKEQTIELQKNTSRAVLSNEKLKTINKLQQKFREALENDLQTPQAVAVVWEMLKSNIPSEDKLDLLYEFDQVLGLNLRNIKEEDIPDEILDIIREREKARLEKDFKKSDELRELLQQKGYVIKDMKGSYKITKI